MPLLKDLKEEHLHGRTVKLPEVLGVDGDYIELELPTGRGNFKVRPMLTKDENVFTTRNKKKFMEPYRKLISNTTDITDVDTLWQNEAMFVLAMIRRISHGDFFQYEFRCQNQACGITHPVETDLSELQVFYASEETRNVVSTGGLFTSEPLPQCGKRIKYRMPVFSDYEKMEALRKSMGKNLRTAALRLCMDSIETEPGSGQFEMISEKVIGNLSVRDTHALNREMDNRSVGLISDVELECESCEHLNHYEIPFQAADFLVNPAESKTHSDGSLSTLYP